MWHNHLLLRDLTHVILAVSTIMLLYAGGFWLTHAPVFPVEKIQIRGDIKNAKPEQMRFIAEHKLSGTFFTLDLDKTRAAFTRLPWVRDIQLRRRWPGALEIMVEEHVALARWGETGLVNTRGEPFDAASEQDLPVFYGQPGAAKEMSLMFAQLRRELAPAGITPAALWLSSRRAWKVKLDNQVQLELGRNDVSPRARLFAQYWKSKLAALPYHIEYVDMRYPNGFAVRMNDYKTPPAKETSD